MAIRWLASVSSFARTTWPSRAAASCSRSGPSARHGPHHSAQKSTTTGTRDDWSMTCSWKSCSVTSITGMAPRVRRVRLNTSRAGEGTPVVLLHGLTATQRYVVMGSRALERGGHDVVAYDARGHGA